MSTLDRRLVGLVTVQPNNPAPGTNLFYTNPEDSRIQILSVYLRLEADSNAANRHVTIEGLQGNFPFSSSPAPANQIADADINYRFGTCMLGIDQTTNLTTQWGVLSSNIYLEPEDKLHTDIINIQIGDQLSAITIRYRKSQPL